MMYTDLMGWYRLANELTTGKDKYFTLGDYNDLIPFERDLFLDLILERNQQAVAKSKVNSDDIISDFEEFPE